MRFTCQPSPATRTQSIDPGIVKTHEALFDTWFPLEDLPIPPAIKPEIASIAGAVSKGMLQAFSQSPGIFGLLAGLTDPTKLPFYACLKQSTNPAVQSLLAGAGGYGAMAPAQRVPLFSFLFEGTCGSATTQVAQQLREIYLNSIWDLPLAVPLTDILSPVVFMPNTDVYAKVHAPRDPAQQAAIRPRHEEDLP